MQQATKIIQNSNKEEDNSENFFTRAKKELGDYLKEVAEFAISPVTNIVYPLRNIFTVDFRPLDKFLDGFLAFGNASSAAVGAYLDQLLDARRCDGNIYPRIIHAVVISLIVNKGLTRAIEFIRYKKYGAIKPIYYNIGIKAVRRINIDPNQDHLIDDEKLSSYIVILTYICVSQDADDTDKELAMDLLELLNGSRKKKRIEFLGDPDLDYLTELAPKLFEIARVRERNAINSKANEKHNGVEMKGVENLATKLQYAEMDKKLEKFLDIANNDDFSAKNLETFIKGDKKFKDIDELDKYYNSIKYRISEMLIMGKGIKDYNNQFTFTGEFERLINNNFKACDYLKNRLKRINLMYCRPEGFLDKIRAFGRTTAAINELSNNHKSIEYKSKLREAISIRDNIGKNIDAACGDDDLGAYWVTMFSSNIYETCINYEKILSKLSPHPSAQNSKSRLSM